MKARLPLETSSLKTLRSSPTLRRHRRAAVALWVALLAAVAPAQAGHWTEPYDVVWNTPSKDAAGSMPLGNGEVGINLWVEDGGDFQFYISRSDAYTEISRLVKVGKVRVSLSPNPFTAGTPFRQELKLCEGACEIIAGPPAQQVKLKVFVDSDSPVVAVTGESAQPVAVKATVESWRTERRVISGDEQGSAWTMHSAPFELAESADVFPADIREAVAWYHRNEESVAFNSTIKLQSLQSVADKAHDPLLHRTFGGWLAGDGFKSAEGHAIATPKPVKSFALRVAAPCAQTSTAQAWLDEARKLGARKISADRTARWWSEFWERSWVMTDAGGTKGLSVGQAFTLQRYVQACGGRGTYPIKFNGGIFTVEPKAMGRPLNADWRAWGDTHWYQNIRHMYHPMLAEGDFEMMSPFFRLYENARPLCEARAQLYHHVEGCYFPETMTVWGTYGNGDYGWNRDGCQPQDVQCKWWRFAWNQGPELVALMLDYWDYTGDRKFLGDQLLPMAVSVLRYFDTRFKRDASGRIILDPTQSVETYWYGVTNDMPTAAGLTSTTARLCALPEKLVPESDRAFFTKMKAACPELPISDGKLAPAQQYQTKTSNCENPELYAVWPFRLFGLDKPSLEVARAAYAARHNHLDAGWGYDGNCAALLGLTDEAARILKVKCANSKPAYRWPATWGPNFDWLPDQNHGGNLLETTELMLLQSSGDKLLLLPAWPKDWDVSFKLHAPGNTTVECVYRAGKVEKLKVTPPSRAADVVSQLQAGL